MCIFIINIHAIENVDKFMKDPYTPIYIRRHIIEVTKPSTIFEIPIYTIGSNNLWVFINGKKEYNEYDYIEETPTSIQFRKTIPAGAIIELLFFREPN